MATKRKTTKQSKTALALEIGAGVAAVVAAGAAGYYYYGSKEAAKHRRKTAKWAKDLEKDVVKNAKKLKRIDAAALASIVDEAAAAYEGIRGVDPKEVRLAAGELKDNWNHIKKSLGSAQRAPAKTAKKVAKKTTKKKVAKKTTR